MTGLSCSEQQAGVQAPTTQLFCRVRPPGAEADTDRAGTRSTAVMTDLSHTLRAVARWIERVVLVVVAHSGEEDGTASTAALFAQQRSVIA